LAAFFIRRAIPCGTLEPAKLRMQDIPVNSGVPYRVQSATAVRRVDYQSGDGHACGGIGPARPFCFSLAHARFSFLVKKFFVDNEK